MGGRFQGKTVVITGGSEGVGAATARAFAAEGANLALAARSKRNLEAIAEELRGQTGVAICAMDVADPDACVTLLKKADFEFGHVDILVNNAGYHARGPVENVDAEELGRIIDVNLRAPIVLTRLAIPYLRKVREAAIINVASLAGRTPVMGAATYSASKFGLRAFTFALADELDGSGIKIAAVSPGPVDTGFIMANIDAVSDITFSQPISTAEEVARVIMDLVTNGRREQAMPSLNGALATLSYLCPPLMKSLRPMLARKGRRKKLQLKARLRANEKA